MFSIENVYYSIIIIWFLLTKSSIAMYFRTFTTVLYRTFCLGELETMPQRFSLHRYAELAPALLAELDETTAAQAAAQAAAKERSKGLPQLRKPCAN